MPIQAIDVRRTHRTYIHQAATDLALLAATRNDPDITDKAKRERSEAIEARLTERYDRDFASATEFVDAARQDFVAHLPGGTRLRAAIDKPDRAVQIQRLAEGASVEEFRQIAARLAEKQDPAGAHGLRRALLGSEINGKDLSAILATLDAIGAGASEPYLADLIGSRWLLAEFERAGAFNDPDAEVMRDPTAALLASRAVGVIPTDHVGGTTQLPKAEIERLLDVAGIERGSAGG